jgi:hypothetical protein
MNAESSTESQSSSSVEQARLSPSTSTVGQSSRSESVATTPQNSVSTSITPPLTDSNLSPITGVRLRSPVHVPNYVRVDEILEVASETRYLKVKKEDVAAFKELLNQFRAIDHMNALRHLGNA